MNPPKILNTLWFSGALAGMVAFPSFGFVIGIVAIETTSGEWKAYIGVASGSNEELDAISIAQLGAKVPLDIAVRLFPEYDAAKFAL